MFTISQIKEAHSRVKSGSDFPTYIYDLVNLGVLKYDTYVSDGHAKYVGSDNFETSSEAKYPTLNIAEKSDAEKFRRYLKIHQEGQTDYLTFCSHSAECGIEKWTVDTVEMTCTYFDKKGIKILTEVIPGKK